MAVKRDYLGECNDRGVPLDDFKMQFCDRCVNPECTRSQYGKSKFDARTNTWFERLFDKPTRMSEQDPRFSIISGQKFMSIDVSRTPEIRSSWNDPRDLKEPEQAPVLVVADPQPLQHRVPTTPNKKLPMPFNTPSTAGGQMLGGREKRDVSPRDPWGTPEAASNSTGTVLEPGAKVKLGGGGGV